MLRAEAEGVRRMPGKIIRLEAEDAEGRKYLLINTEHPEHYMQFQKPAGNNHYHTFKINDKAQADLLETGIIRGKVDGIDIAFEIDDKFAERLLSKQN